MKLLFNTNEILPICYCLFQLAKTVEEKMSQLSCSSDLEVQERASVLLSFLKFVSKHLEKGENLATELSVFFDGELNPVSSFNNLFYLKFLLSIESVV